MVVSADGSSFTYTGIRLTLALHTLNFTSSIEYIHIEIDKLQCKIQFKPVMYVLFNLIPFSIYHLLGAELITPGFK